MHPNIRRVKGHEQFAKAADSLRREGFESYEALCFPKIFSDSAGPRDEWGCFIDSEIRAGIPSESSQHVPALFFSGGNESLADVCDIGTKGMGYIDWGLGNKLPNVVSMLTQMLPYTAAGVKFNSDMLAGLGPQPMYDVTQYIGGNITTSKIRYKDAGCYIKGRLSDKYRELLNLSEKEGVDAVASLRESLMDEIARLEADYAIWEQTNEDLRVFIDNNNLAHTWLAMSIDEVLFGICFPELLLNLQGLDRRGLPVDSADWHPKVVGFSHRPCLTTRFERMDESQSINFVYCSNRWLDPAYASEGKSGVAPEIYAVPVLDPAHPLVSLRKKVREARAGNVPVADRPTHFVLPSAYPTAGRPYYPTPAWYSIFGGAIYEYLSTIISDRFNRKKNSNIIGRVIYLHHEYLQQLATQKDQDGNVRSIEEVRDEFYATINTWLSNRQNVGQSLLAFNFQGRDGQTHKSFEIVEIATANKGVADANEKETAEISSIVFMALGLDARLLGSSPLSLVGSSGGTDIRERFLLRQILMSPTQNIMLKSLDVVSRYNGWDPHLVWDIRREVMTTLDRSKSGVAEAETN